MISHIWFSLSVVQEFNRTPPQIPYIPVNQNRKSDSRYRYYLISKYNTSKLLNKIAIGFIVYPFKSGSNHNNPPDYEHVTQIHNNMSAKLNSDSIYTKLWRKITLQFIMK